MTAIAGLVDKDGAVWIGGDSAGIAGYSRTVRADAKVFTKGPYVFGFCGSFRMGQLIRYALDAPVPDKGEKDLPGFMVMEFVEALRATLREGGHTFIEHNTEEIAGSFLVGIRGRLFCIEGDYQVGEPTHPYAAVGCGDDLALGSLYTTALPHLAWHPRDRIRRALEAASTFSAGVHPPYVIKSVKP